LRTRELLRKDLAELTASRAWWLLLVVVGLLTGQAFIGAVHAYAEMSAPNALAQGLSPLDGIVVPTLGAYELAIMLLFPFVAIRLVATERETGALKIVLQWPVTRAEIMIARCVTLLLAWLISLIPFGLAMIAWAAYGGHLHAGETVNVLAGYSLRFFLTASLSMLAAALLPGAANAAVAVLAFTIGTWALDFLGAGRGGLIERLAAYAPAAVSRSFERGLFRLDVVLVLCVLSIATLALTSIWLDLGATLRRRMIRTVGVCAIAVILAIAAANVTTSFDASENRRNSFAPAEARALSQIAGTLEMTVRLSSEDPRLADLENNVLVKLRRAMRVDVRYPLEGRTGLFDDDTNYGTIEYRLGEKRAVNRSTTEAIVIGTICELAGIAVPSAEESAYAGHPLRAQPRGAAWIFYVVWPAVTLLAARRSRRTG
jgi:hypothetical protein